MNRVKRFGRVTQVRLFSKSRFLHGCDRMEEQTLPKLIESNTKQILCRHCMFGAV